ncbi:protein AF1q [Heterodontus francisci]|uniref:protein AF1q n=1 Tax=Heterodontus francisci TaxID=7792 RepID=UPI00355C8C46
MLDLLNSQYDSFLFWRMPIPMIDLAEIEVLGLAVPKPGSGGQTSAGKPHASQSLSEEDDETLAEYNTFNFWRAPIASFSGLELELLGAC